MSNPHVYEIAKRIVSEIEGLNLPGSPDVRARKRIFADDGQEDSRPMHRGITVSPDDDTPAGGTNERENVGYRFAVGMLDGSSTEFLDEEFRVATWGEKIRRRFQFRRIGDLPSTMCELHCNVGPHKRPDRLRLNDGDDFAMLRITCFVREARS